jgi:DNA polymerase III, alpha subunit
MRRILVLAGQLVDFPHYLSQHPGGFVISERPLHTMVPVENAAMDQRTVIQWDKDDLEALGLLKVDVLALGMLTALRRTFDLVRRHRGLDYSMATLPPNDPKTFAMIARPTPSACSRSNRARRWRCCRGCSHACSTTW